MVAGASVADGDYMFDGTARTSKHCKHVVLHANFRVLHKYDYKQALLKACHKDLKPSVFKFIGMEL